MVIEAQLRHVIAASIVMSLFCKGVSPRNDEPTKPPVAEQKEESSGLKFVRTPVTEQRVNDFVNSVRSQLKQVKTPDSLAERDAYMKELVGVLHRFVVKDVLRENRNWADDRTLWLSDRTSTRVIRLLGDLNADEAVETIAEHLLLPWDLELLRQQGPEDQPTTWALFQIGDASLPFLRTKMTTDGKWIPLRAMHTAAYILGPRAEKQLDKWINEAETAEQRERLAKYSSYFMGTTRRAEWKNLFTPEEYRRVMLEEGRRRLEKLLDQPTMAEIVEWERKQEEAKRARGEKH